MIKSGINIVRFAKKFVSMRKMTDEEYAKKAASFLIDVAREEGGMLFKFMQYLDTDARYDSFEHLSEQNDFAMPIEEVIKLYEDEFNIQFRDHFKKIEETPYLASLSQVHIATSIDEKKYIIKLQYPQIKSKVKDQLRLLNLIPKKGFGPIKKWGVDIGLYQKMFEDILDKELNYQLEVENMHQMQKLIPENSNFIIAQTHDHFCSRTIITQEYIDGVHFDKLKQYSKFEQEQIIYLLVESFLNLLVEEGYYQGDTNFGNFLFDITNMKIGMIDLGQLQFLKYQKREVLFSYVKKLIQKEKVDHLAYYIALGFDEQKLIHLEDYLGMLSEIIFEPFVNDMLYDLSSWQYKKKLDLLLGENKWWFRSAGDEDFFLLMKSFTGLKAFVQDLGVKLNWHRILRNSLDQSEYDYTPSQSRKSSQLKSYSKSLSCVVVRNGKESVNLTFPIKAIFDLESIMDSDLVDDLKKSGILFENIINDAFKDGGRPKVLFTHENEHRVVNVSMIE